MGGLSEKVLQWVLSFVNSVAGTKDPHLKNEMPTNQQDKYFSPSSPHWQGTYCASQLLQG